MTHSIYCHNPYPGLSSVIKKVTSHEEDFSMGAPHPSGLSDSDACETRSSSPPIVEEHHEEEGMGRRSNSHYFDALSPMLPFYEYGRVSHMVRRNDAEQMGLVRLFVGQVPYHLDAESVAWMLQLLSNRPVPLVEKIVKWTQSRKPCGCFHVYCAQEDVAALMAVDQTVLCEEEGMWVARDALEHKVLADHCKMLADNKDARAPLMPYQLMTVQEAKSTYQRPSVNNYTAQLPQEAASRRPINMVCYPAQQQRQRVTAAAPAHFSLVSYGVASQPHVQFPTHANQLW